MTETWKDIKGYEGLYQISNLGEGKRKTAGGYIWSYEKRGGD